MAARAAILNFTLKKIYTIFEHNIFTRLDVLQNTIKCVGRINFKT
jgi:hypothetical protein